VQAIFSPLLLYYYALEAFAATGAGPYVLPIPSAFAVLVSYINNNPCYNFIKSSGSDIKAAIAFFSVF